MFGSVDFSEFREQLALADWEANVDLVTRVSDSDFDHFCAFLSLY